MTDENVQNFSDENLSAWECFIFEFLTSYDVCLVVIVCLSTIILHIILQQSINRKNETSKRV